jgi:hypothetical protein
MVSSDDGGGDCDVHHLLVGVLVAGAGPVYAAAVCGVWDAGAAMVASGGAVAGWAGALGVCAPERWADSAYGGACSVKAQVNTYAIRVMLIINMTRVSGRVAAGWDVCDR